MSTAQHLIMAASLAVNVVPAVLFFLSTRR